MARVPRQQLPRVMIYYYVMPRDAMIRCFRHTLLFLRLLRYCFERYACAEELLMRQRYKSAIAAIYADICCQENGQSTRTISATPPLTPAVFALLLLPLFMRR